MLQVILRCSVESKSGRLQWTRDGFGLGQERDLPGFPRMRMVGLDAGRDWHLEILQVKLEDEGKYQCQVLARDSSQSIRSSTARLEVRAPCSSPTLEGGPLLQLQAGVATSLQCSCRGARPPATLHWQLGGGGPGRETSLSGRRSGAGRPPRCLYYLCSR